MFQNIKKHNDRTKPPSTVIKSGTANHGRPSVNGYASHWEGLKMRIEIKTKGKVTDSDIRALYIIVYGLNNSTQKMKVANLQYVADKLGYKLVKA